MRGESQRSVSVGVVVINIVAILVIVLWSVVLMKRLDPPPGQLHDFVQEWTSAKNYFLGHPIYEDLNASIERYLQLRVKIVVDVNAHPPTSVLFMLPFGQLEYKQAYQAWSYVSLLMLAVSVFWLLRYCGASMGRGAILPIVALIMTSSSFAQQVHLGQLSILLLFMTTAAFVAMRSGRDSLAGVVLGAATAIKLFPGFLFLYFLVHRKWSAIAAGAATFIGLTAVTIAVFGVGVFGQYVSDVVPHLSQYREYWLNASLPGLWSKLFSGMTGHVIPVVQSSLLTTLLTVASVIVITLIVARVVFRSHQQDGDDRGFALCMIAMLIVSPITWDHYFLMLILPMAILWRVDAKTKSRKLAVFGLFFALLTINPVWIWNATIPGNGELAFIRGEEPSVATPVHTLTVLSYHLYALLTLFGVGVAWSRPDVLQSSYTTKPRGAQRDTP